MSNYKELVKRRDETERNFLMAIKGVTDDQRLLLRDMQEAFFMLGEHSVRRHQPDPKQIKAQFLTVNQVQDVARGVAMDCIRYPDKDAEEAIREIVRHELGISTFTAPKPTLEDIVGEHPATILRFCWGCFLGALVCLAGLGIYAAGQIAANFFWEHLW